MRWRVMVLLKRSAYDLYVARHQDPNITSLLSNTQVIGNLQDRHRVHEHTLQVCRQVLDHRQSYIQYETRIRDQLEHPIHNMDLVITIGGDGTLLQASHYLDNSIPILGVNSDPTLTSEVEEKLDEFDATRSSGHLCAATAGNFEQVLDEILEGTREPVKLRRISTFVDGIKVSSPALNDVLVAHPNPAAVSRCTFSILREETGKQRTPVIHSRSSGLRICTAAGSTAAMKSAGGDVMPLSSTDLQYMVREPNTPHPKYKDFLRGWIRADEALYLNWRCRQGMVYFDGSHLCHPIKFGSKIEISSFKAPALQIFMVPQE
ncbi:hypothetical protein CY35_13G069700 [Sphagnum magellanicum]|nr:hypothetical protein CY35_13G069700 [Sphagnum magellanicum]